MALASIILQGLLALLFSLNGVTKMATMEPHVGHFRHFGLPLWFLRIVGLVELLGAAGLLVGIWLPFVAVLAAAWLVATMFFAILTHIFLGHDSANQALPAMVLLVLSLVILVVNWPALLRVMAL